ncbi:hypothetical protein M3Y95_01048700 [Aphelenchoides besseyi]|nr:hypothetical protein M3Y95_01048700 [Aphelenchoides besseyi]
MNVILRINYIAAFVLGCVFNPLLIYLILRRSPTGLKAYRPILLIAAFSDGFAILMFGFCQTETLMIDNVGLYILKGPAKYLSEIGQYVALALSFINTNLEVLVLLLETRSPMPWKQLLKPVLVILFVCLIQLPILVSDYIFYRDVYKEYGYLWPQENIKSYVLIIHFKIHWVYQLLGIVVTVVSLGSVLMSIFLAVWSIRLMKKEVTKMSKKTQDLLNQFSRTIVMRIILFLSTIVIPQINVLITRYFVIDGTIVNQISLLLYIWLPTINSTFSIACIKTYRHILLSAFRQSLEPFHLQPPLFITSVQTYS